VGSGTSKAAIARRASVLLAIAGTVLALAACGGSSGESSSDEGTGFDEVFASIEGLSGDERHDRLVELAQQEGELSLYTSMAADRVAEILDAFEGKFDIDVAVYRANSETIVPRLLEEAKAGFRGADVVRVQGLAMVNLNDEGILVDYSSPQLENLLDGTTFEGWTADSFSTFVVSWNTELVPEAERPTSWEDLADPRWKGLVAIEAGDVNWYAALRDYWLEQGKSEEEVDGLFEAIAGNALVVRGHTLLGQLMAAGEVAVGPNYALRVDAFAKDGAPLAWQPPVEPIFPEPQGVGLVKGAQHPAAALLFADWLLSEGQPILAAQEADPARRDLAAAPDSARRVIDVAAIAADQEALTESYDQLLRLGREADEG
jgi:iron(III) transport system substrate-binding protein